MPVTGLPAAVEKTLSALLSENAVSSWKIAGEGSNTVVVLRLKPVDPVSTNMAEPVLNRTTQVQYYRKKPPGQIRRDQQRARQQRDKQAGRQCDGERVVDALSVTDTCEEEQHGLVCRPSDTLHTQTAHTEHSDHATSDVSETTDTVEPLGATGCDLQLPADLPEMNCEHPVNSTVAGFEVGVVSSYVASLVDKTVQRQLRARHRNKTFRKVVSHKPNNVDMLLCESDDIVLEIPCLSDSDGGCTYWFVKQNEKNMLTEECVRLANLQKGRSVGNTRHAEVQARAERELHALHDLIQFYLG
eukprot:TRINITY_DN20050_c0_g1_i10.p1 TRINITY_DN20050_c0_g1~~TRINITY_DN20050_c0_g1_i10.p1  ORF type:complete len:301 (-),score=66.62 TRINITY_DN20050_c0_g1_i10:243-1145(-)